MYALPWSLSDECDYTRRRSRDHRREYLRGLRQCASACPTGAASYALPPEDALMRRLRAMLIAYREAGGEQAIVLVHVDSHGAPLIDALARFGDGLPACVLRLRSMR
jgi:hypothetical protein